MSIPHFKDSEHTISNYLYPTEEYEWENDLFELQISGSKNYLYWMAYGNPTFDTEVGLSGRLQMVQHKTDKERLLYTLSLKPELIIKKDYYDSRFNEKKMQQLYLIHLIYCKTPDPSEEVIKLIESNDLTNIELAYLLTYPNEES